MPITAAAILEKKFLVRTSFRFAGKRYRSFDEVIPKDEGWKAEKIIDLVKVGRIMPFDDSIPAEVFHEIPYMQKRSPLGFAAAEFVDVSVTGKLDDNFDGISDPTKIKAASRLMSILAYTRDGEKKQTYETEEYPYDTVPVKDMPVIPEGADKPNTEPLKTSLPEPPSPEPPSGDGTGITEEP